jgi:Fe-S-cluster containining protein
LDSPTRRTSTQLRPRQGASGSFTSDEGEVRYPAHLRWVCVRCAKSCGDLLGRRRNILLALGDLIRITDATKLTAREFSVSSRGPLPYVRKMRKLGGRCIFLQDSRCSIYGARPLICRFYPFSLRPAGDNAFDIGFDSSCSGIGKGPRRSERFFRSLIRLANRELRSQQELLNGDAEARDNRGKCTRLKSRQKSEMHGTDRNGDTNT